MIANRNLVGQHATRVRLWLATMGLAALAIGCGSSPEPQPDASMGDGAIYQLGVLRQGPHWSGARNALEDSLQRAHLANMQRMFEEGLMVAAGPFAGGGEMRGLFIFAGSSVAAIERETQHDPRIATERLRLDLYPWDAPAGIGVPYRMRLEKGLADSMVALPFALVRRGPHWNGDASARAYAEAFGTLLDAGQVATSGALEGGGDLMAAMVFHADSATARRWVDDQPAVQSGEIAIDLLEWWTAYGAMPGDTL